MKHLLIALALSAGVMSGSAFATSHKEAPDMAASASAPMGKQQNKMATCNTDAGEKKGDERKAFMKSCLSAKKPTQQTKMKTCNADAKGKTGEDRKAFMKSCLSS
ncbi:MAG: PsiF family protein [Pseudomonadota bacterium]|nr:PsiF family protein [Pseudomonadota bacterium]